jgi:ATP-dependent Lon protease
VRNLEREIGRLFRKIARLKSEKRPYPSRILSSSLEKYLGPKQLFQMEGEQEDEVGVATALAWTESGGEIMPVEVLLYEGKGNLQMTGQIGDIMQESAQAALSYIKSCSEEFGIDSEIFERIDIHLHVPEGAIPKDGPSAGITMAVALLSALTDRKIYKDIGMTGEITLRGKVLQVGGVKEKILAAKRAGLSRVLIPEKNDKDLFEVPKKILNGIEIIPVSHIDQVIELALFPPSPDEEEVDEEENDETEVK